MTASLFARFASLSFQKQITYRFDYFMGVINGFLYVFIFTSLWKALYSHSPESSHGGFSLEGIITYAVLAMVVRIAFSMDDTVIYHKVRDGSVSLDLIRPVSFFFMNLADCAGYSLFHILARAIPILLISAFIFDISISAGADNLIAFLVSAMLGYLIMFMLNYLIGLLSFWFLEVFPFMLFKYGMITIFSGGIVPVDFFPEFMKPVLAIMPFQYLLYVPTVILMGHAKGDAALSLIAGQAAWVAVLGFACHFLWNAGKSKLVIQGG